MKKFILLLAATTALAQAAAIKADFENWDGNPFSWKLIPNGFSAYQPGGDTLKPTPASSTPKTPASKRSSQSEKAT